VDPAFQNKGVGARLKWSQRERALQEGRDFIKWTWDPMQARNAHFNLNRLGVIVSSYAVNFYGTDYGTNPVLTNVAAGIDSDRLFAEWQLKAGRVSKLANGDAAAGETAEMKPAATIEVPVDWTKLCRDDPGKAREEQLRVRAEFQQAFAAGLVAAAFERSPESPRYLLYERNLLHD